MKKSTILLSCLALALLLSLSVGGALAYFTAWTSASGTIPLRVGPGESTMTETVDANNTKHIAVTNTGTVPCYVRVRAFAGAGTVWDYVPAAGWTADGDWMVCGPLEPGAAANELLIAVTVPAAASNGDAFSVTVVSESVPALYRADGTAYADWSFGTGGGVSP